MTDERTCIRETVRPLTLGTAGHIDHGKTTLIKTLTGRDTDRLREEKERGISIELGFAELTLPSGRRLSVVDVPGHERFVKTMVAGATGIDLFLLVVAADDGVMPQTCEHLRIIELLDIPAGMVALTKTDMVERDLAELACAGVEELLDTTRYAKAPIVLVSGVTGEGLPELAATLDRLGAQVPPRPAYPATRMPVDRVFSLKGVGTIVTGTLWSGCLTAGDKVALLPPRSARGSGELRVARVRSVQVHDQEVAAAVGGQRVALSLTGIEREEVSRGQWVVNDPAIEPTFLADVNLTLLSDAPEPLPRVSRVRVHHGTAEILGKIVLVDRETLEPGGHCYAQIRFEESALVYPGDHFIVRSVTPVTTIGGGRVIDSAPHKHGAGTRWHDRLLLLEQGPSDDIVAILLQEAFPSAIVRGRLGASPYLWRFASADIEAAVASLLADGRALPVDVPAFGPNVRLFHGPSLLALSEATLSALRARAVSGAMNPYMTVGELRREMARSRDSPALDAVLDRLQTAGEVVRNEHGYRWGESTGDLDAASSEIGGRLLAQFETEAGEGIGLGVAETPSVAVAAAAAGLNLLEARKIIDALVRQGQLVKVGEDLYYPSIRLEALMARLSVAMEGAGQLTLAEARDLLTTSRRYAQALLEHMDSEGLTLRVGEARRLRRRR